MGISIPVPRIYRTIGFAGQKVTSGREGGQWAYFSWDFMVRIQVTINNASKTAEEDFVHRFVFPPLPPPLRFRRERLLPSFRSSSSAAENCVRDTDRFLNHLHFQLRTFRIAYFELDARILGW